MEEENKNRSIGEIIKENEELQIKLKNKQSEIDYLKGQLSVYEKMFVTDKDIENLLEEYKNLKETKIIQNKNIRKGQPVINGTRLTCIDILLFMTEFIKKHEEEFRKNYADINSKQIVTCINYLLEDSISKQKIKDKIEELKELVEDFEKTDNTGRFKRTKSIDYYKLEALEELLQEENK